MHGASANYTQGEREGPGDDGPGQRGGSSGATLGQAHSPARGAYREVEGKSDAERHEKGGGRLLEGEGGMANGRIP